MTMMKIRMNTRVMEIVAERMKTTTTLPKKDDGLNDHRSYDVAGFRHNHVFRRRRLCSIPNELTCFRIKVYVRMCEISFSSRCGCCRLLCVHVGQAAWSAGEL